MTSLLEVIRGADLVDAADCDKNSCPRCLTSQVSCSYAALAVPEFGPDLLESLDRPSYRVLMTTPHAGPVLA